MPEFAPESNLLSRIELLQLAQSLGVSDADVMTRVELRAAIDKARRPEPSSTDQQPATWVGVARRLLASVVERGLNLPDAASLIRGDTKLNAPPKAPPPVATVTLARIYGAQGHFDRAIATLDEVLESDPDHELARELRNQLAVRRSESQARASNPTPAPARAEPESAPTSPVNEADKPSHAPRPSRLESVNSLDGIEARPFADLDAGAEAPSAEASPPFEASPTSAQPPPWVDAPATEAPGTEASPAVLSLDADAGLVAPAFASAPPSVQPPFVDAPNRSEPDFAEAPPSAQPPAYVGDPTLPEPPFAEAPLSAQPPAFIDTLTGSGDSFTEAPSSEQPPAYVDAPLASAPEFTTPVADAPELAPGPLTVRLDPDAELVAPAFDVIERDAQPGETPTGHASAPALYAEPPTMVSTMALDRETPPASVYLESEPPPTSMSEVSGPELDSRSNEAASSEAHFESAPATTERLPDPTAPLIADTPPSHPPNGVSNGIQNGAEPLPLAAALVPTPPPPKVPGLVLIETDTPIRFLYWELAASGVGAVHWIHIVTHTPNRRGDTERHERRFPVQSQLGALRLEGVPAHAVVRARLTQEPNDPRALVVASSVKPRALGAAAFEIRFSPHARAKPEALATRAQPLLERASPVYWDC